MQHVISVEFSTFIIVTNSLLLCSLKQGYYYHKFRKAFSKFYRRLFELIEKYHVSLKNFCNKSFLIQNSMEIQYINLQNSLEIQTLIFSYVLVTVSKEQI